MNVKETNNNASATLMKSPNLEECEHDGPIVTTPHEGKTTKDELGDLRWLMISMKAQRSHIPKEPQITRSWLEVQSVLNMKNQYYELQDQKNA